MRFIEMTGKSLRSIVRDDELHRKDLRGAGVRDDTVVRVNEQGDIEVRLRHGWDVIGGLLGNFEERVAKKPVWIGPDAIGGQLRTSGQLVRPRFRSFKPRLRTDIPFPAITLARLVTRLDDVT